MEIIESNYRDDVVFVGHNFEKISNDTMAEAIERSTGRDFNGIGREEMEASHTNTNKDLKAFGQLYDAYQHVEFVTLHPAR